MAEDLDIDLNLLLVLHTVLNEGSATRAAARSILLMTTIGGSLASSAFIRT